MSISRVQSNSNLSTASTSNAVTLAAGFIQGNLLVAQVASTTTGITWTPPTGWTTVVNNAAVAEGVSIYAFIVTAGIAGTTTISFGLSLSASSVLLVNEWNSTTGWSSATPDQTQKNNGSGTAISTGATATTTQASELWVAGLCYSGAAQAEGGLPAAWTYDTEQTGGPNVRTAYQLATATGAASAALTFATSATWGGSVATFMPSTGSVALSTTIAGVGTLTATLTVPGVPLAVTCAGVGAFSGTLAGAGGLPLTIQIAGAPIVFDEDTFTLRQTADERWRCQFTVLDYAGTQQFSYRQQVLVTDSVRGRLFKGFVVDSKQDKSATYPDGMISHLIDTVDTWSLADKRTSNKRYSNQQAGVIAVDQVQRYLAAEGVTVAAALRWDELLSDWQAGTLAGTVATTNAMDSNPGDGDLELALSGTSITITESTSATFNTGTLTGVVGASGGLLLVTTPAIKFTGSVGDNFSNNTLSTYRKFWTGSYTCLTGDLLQWDSWVASSSPEIKASVDFLFSDGSWMSKAPNIPTDFQDEYGLTCDAGRDLKGYADDQWMHRQSIIQASNNGKVIVAAYLVFGGNTGGDYLAYVRNAKITDSTGGTVRTTLFVRTMIANVQGSSTGYFNVGAVVVTTYERTGVRVSPSHSITNVGIVQGSILSWAESDAVQPTGGSSSSTFPQQVLVESSIDGGATWQTCSNQGAIPLITAGMNTAGRSVLIRETLSVGGASPETTPILKALAFTVVSAPAATKTDVVDIDGPDQASLATGTLTNCSSVSGVGVQTTGAYRTWDDFSLASQTVTGSGAVNTQGVTQNQLELRTDPNGEVKSQFSFAGQWGNFMLECDIEIKDAIGNFGLVYRTTSWINTNNCYAYNVYLTTSGITLYRGSNGTVGSTFIVGSAPMTLIVGAFYRLKCVINGSSHQFFLNDTLLLSLTDATFTSGYVGARYYSAGTTGRQSAFFDNFGIIGYDASFQSISSRKTVPLVLTAAGTLSGSLIAWSTSPANPGGQLLVESTLDGGTTWATCTNGASIPALVAGYNASGKSVQVRATMTNDNVNLPIAITGMAAWIFGQYSASGTRTSPSLSLSAVGRAGTALVNWNAILPIGTALVVKTSLDGGATFQTVASPGGAIAGITTQPQPFVESFQANDSASYVQTSLAVTGGGAATWTWNTANSRLLATQTTGIDGVLHSTAPSFADANVQGLFNQSDSGGLVVRMVDTTHCYLLSIRDGSAATSPNTVALYKVAGTSATLLGSASIAFVRGMYHIFTLDAQGTTLIATMDGATLLTVTDGGVTAAGKTGILAGMTNGHSIQCYGFRSQPYGDNVSSESLITKVTLTSTDPTVTPQLLDLQAFVASPAIGAGTLLPATSYVRTFVDKNLDDLAKQSNFMWLIDQFNVCSFQGRQALPAPWVLASNTLAQPSDLEVDANLLVEMTGDLYRNRQVLTNVINSASFADPFVGNGQQVSFPLRYPVAPGTIPTATLNGQAQTLGLAGTAGSQWYYTPGSVTIAQDTSQPKLGPFDLLVVSYTGTFPDEVVANNVPAQTALASVEGGSGIVESVIDVSSMNMTYAAAVVYANQLLIRYCVTDSANKPTGRTLTYMTKRDGLTVGQIQTVFVPEEHLNNVQLLIQQIDITMRTQPGNTVLYSYLVVASELPNPGSWSKLFASGLLG